MQKIIIVVLFFTGFLACKSDDKKVKLDSLTYEAVKESLGDKEKKNPVHFLTANIRHRKNIIGQTVVIGNLSNHATICSYKDVEIKLSFYSKTAVKLDEGIETIYENIAPGKAIKFKTKYFAPKGTDSVSVVITKAIGEAGSLKN